jgi:predicted porin
LNEESTQLFNSFTVFIHRRFVMNKKIIALAVAAATLAPVAMAQTANPVTLYGRVYVMFENVKADGGSAAPISSRNRVNNNGASLLGVRGTEDLGGGLKAFFQLETEFRPDQNDTTFGTRNSGVGLQGDFGSVLLGRWDTPFKLANAPYDVFGDTTLAGYTSAMSDRGNFNRREQNVVQYWSPNFSGVQFRASYSANEGKTATTNPVVTSFNATYNKGPISLAYGYEKHKDLLALYTANNTATATSGASEKGHSLGGTVTFGPVRVGGLMQRFVRTSGVFVPSIGNITTTPVQKSAMFNILYTAGKHQFAAQFQRSEGGRTRSVTTPLVPQPDAKVNSVGYFYNFSRRTSLITVYTQNKNNVAGLSNFGQNPLNSGNAIIAGDQDPRGFAIGFRHTF